MRTVTVQDGREVHKGDWVCFKSDVEQTGKITHIADTAQGILLTLHSRYGFQGDYIGGQEITTQLAGDCWVED